LPPFSFHFYHFNYLHPSLPFHPMKALRAVKPLCGRVKCPSDGEGPSGGERTATIFTNFHPSSPIFTYSSDEGATRGECAAHGKSPAGGEGGYLLMDWM
jgi:hypothetical protein